MVGGGIGGGAIGGGAIGGGAIGGGAIGGGARHVNTVVVNDRPGAIHGDVAPLGDVVLANDLKI
jgi:hypothetical protein